MATYDGPRVYRQELILRLQVTGVFFFQAEDGIRDLVRSRGLGDVYKRQVGASAVGEPGDHLAKQPAAIADGTAVLVGAQVGTRVQELVDQVAVGLSLIHI